MSPLRTQLSVTSKDKNFPLLRRAESFRDGEGCESGRLKQGRRKSKDRKKQRDQSEDKIRERKNAFFVPSSSSNNNSEGTNKFGPPTPSGSSGFAASLAATLSPLSSFVASHSPRLSRKGSPSPSRANDPQTSGVPPESLPSANDKKFKKYTLELPPPGASASYSPSKARRKTLKTDAPIGKFSSKPHRTKSLTLKVPKTSDDWAPDRSASRAVDDSSCFASCNSLSPVKPDEECEDSCALIFGDEDDDTDSDDKTLTNSEDKTLTSSEDVPTVTFDLIDDEFGDDDDSVAVVLPPPRIPAVTIADDWQGRLLSQHVAKHE